MATPTSGPVLAHSAPAQWPSCCPSNTPRRSPAEGLGVGCPLDPRTLFSQISSRLLFRCPLSREPPSLSPHGRVSLPDTSLIAGPGCAFRSLLSVSPVTMQTARLFCSPLRAQSQHKWAPHTLESANARMTQVWSGTGHHSPGDTVGPLCPSALPLSSKQQPRPGLPPAGKGHLCLGLKPLPSELMSGHFRPPWGMATHTSLTLRLKWPHRSYSQD